MAFAVLNGGPEAGARNHVPQTAMQFQQERMRKRTGRRVVREQPESIAGLDPTQAGESVLHPRTGHLDVFVDVGRENGGDRREVGLVAAPAELDVVGGASRSVEWAGMLREEPDQAFVEHVVDARIERDAVGRQAGFCTARNPVDLVPDRRTEDERDQYPVRRICEALRAAIEWGTICAATSAPERERRPVIGQVSSWRARSTVTRLWRRSNWD